MKTFAVAVIVTCCLATTPPVPPLETAHLCGTGSISWEYVNHTGDPVTISKQRLRIPGHPLDTTLDATPRDLEPGGVWRITYPGIATCEEGSPCDLSDPEGFPDGTYTVDVWLTNGVTDWFTKQQTRRTCDADG